MHTHPAKNNRDIAKFFQTGLIHHRYIAIVGRTKYKKNNQFCWFCLCKCGNYKKLHLTTKQIRFSRYIGCKNCVNNRMLHDILKNAKKNRKGCLIYQGYKNKDGYGMIWYIDENGKRTSSVAPRMLYKLKLGIPDLNLQVCHKCDNPSCVNIEHLFLGTAKDNVNDMLHKGRGNHAKGIKNGNSKLTLEVVEKIRKIEKKLSETEIKQKFGISKSTFYRIRKNQTWLKE